MRRPHSSLVVKLIGPRRTSAPFERAHESAAAIRAAVASGDVASKNPNVACFSPWNES